MLQVGKGLDFWYMQLGEMSWGFCTVRRLEGFPTTPQQSDKAEEKTKYTDHFSGLIQQTWPETDGLVIVRYEDRIKEV